jgi:hypothetical protein
MVHTCASTQNENISSRREGHTSGSRSVPHHKTDDYRKNQGNLHKVHSSSPRAASVSIRAKRKGTRYVHKDVRGGRGLGGSPPIPHVENANSSKKDRSAGCIGRFACHFTATTSTLDPPPDYSHRDLVTISTHGYLQLVT